MEFTFTEVHYDAGAFLERDLPHIPKSSGVYKIFDTHGELIVLDKTSHLFQRLDRFFGERSEKLKDLDLRFSQLTDAGVEKLQKAMPKAKINY